MWGFNHWRGPRYRESRKDPPKFLGHVHGFNASRQSILQSVYPKQYHTTLINHIERVKSRDLQMFQTDNHVLMNTNSLKRDPFATTTTRADIVFKSRQPPRTKTQ